MPSTSSSCCRLPNLARQPDITHSIALPRARAGRRPHRGARRLRRGDGGGSARAPAAAGHRRLARRGSSATSWPCASAPARWACPCRPSRRCFNYAAINDYMARVPAPWVLKPRSEASSMGIKKMHQPEQLWHALDELGDRQTYFVLEKFRARRCLSRRFGDLGWRGALCRPPSATACRPWPSITAAASLPRAPCCTAATWKQSLHAINRQVIAAMGLERGVTHAEFIRSDEDGQLLLPGDCGARAAAPASTGWWSTPPTSTRGWSGRGRWWPTCAASL